MIERWLLYDAGCSPCAALAREVEALSEGRLRVRSLREPEVQTRLNRVRPGWRWEPMLLEAEGERVRVYTGLAMRMQLVRVLGPVRAWRVAQLVARFGGPVLGVDWGRRRLLQQGGALAGLALLGWTHSLRRLIISAASVPLVSKTGDQFPEVERWGPFLLLRPGAPMPAEVRDYQWGIPTMCGLGEPTHQDAYVQTFESAQELIRITGWRLYGFKKIPNVIFYESAGLIKWKNDLPFGGWLNLYVSHPTHQVPFPGIRIMFQKDFPDPIPLWIDPGIQVHKGIWKQRELPYVALKNPVGFTLHLIDSLYFTFCVEHFEINIEEFLLYLNTIN